MFKCYMRMIYAKDKRGYKNKWCLDNDLCGMGQGEEMDI